MEWYHIVEIVGAIILIFIVGYGFGRVNFKAKVLDAMKDLSMPEYEKLKRRLKL